MKINQSLQKSSVQGNVTFHTRSLTVQSRLIWLIRIVVVFWAAGWVITMLSAQPVVGTAPTKPLDANELDDFFASQLSQKPFVGISVAIVQGGQMRFCKGYGYALKEANRQVNTETRFAVASVTKEFTAALIFLLSEEGKLSVYDPVAKYFPDLTRAQDVRLLDLMNMVSGYHDFYPLDFLTREMNKPTAPDAVINEYAKRPLDFEPGTRWSYSSTNYTILGRVIEVVSGQSYESFLQERILKPLGMTHSGFEPDPAGSEAAQGYASFTISEPQPTLREGAGWMYSAGALYTTPSDMMKWDLALMNGKVLKPESYSLMTTNRLLKNGSSVSYGCGLGVREVNGETVFVHDGIAAGFLSFTEFVPSTQSAFFITVNSDNVSTDDLVERIKPLLLPADRRSPLPTIIGPGPVAVAAGLFAGLQQGKIDRSSLGPDFSAFLTPEKLELAASAFAKLGEPQSVEIVSTFERGGMVHNTLDFKFQKTSLMGDLYRTPDGIVQEFIMSAK